MKLSGIFWLIIIIAIHYLVFKLGCDWFIGCYVLWMVIGIIIHNKIDHIDIRDGDDTVDVNEMWDLFLEYPYLYTLIHLGFIGILIGSFMSIYLIIKKSWKYLSNFNEVLDNIDFKPKPKPKKKSFGEFKSDILD